MQDTPAIAAACRAAGVWTLMDNTWAAGLLFKPLEHGVDISMQALTKYVGGHSDTFMGSICVNDPVLSHKLNAAWREVGWGVSPEDAWIMLRGLRTLPVRLQRHGENALAVARWLVEQPQVCQVLHPALAGDPGHALWARDFRGTSGLFGVVLQPGSEAAVRRLLDALTLFGLGFSWGGYESLAVNSDPQFGKRRFKPDFKGPVLRLSIGLESPSDLIDDLANGLAAYAD
jgi:cystathionine beta-lyase